MTENINMSMKLYYLPLPLFLILLQFSTIGALSCTDMLIEDLCLDQSHCGWCQKINGTTNFIQCGRYKPCDKEVILFHNNDYLTCTDFIVPKDHITCTELKNSVLASYIVSGIVAFILICVLIACLITIFRTPMYQKEGRDEYEEIEDDNINNNEFDDIELLAEV